MNRREFLNKSPLLLGAATVGVAIAEPVSRGPEWMLIDPNGRELNYAGYARGVFDMHGHVKFPPIEHGQEHVWKAILVCNGRQISEQKIDVVIRGGGTVTLVDNLRVFAPLWSWSELR